MYLLHDCSAVALLLQVSLACFRTVLSATRVCSYIPHGSCCRSCVSQLLTRAAPVAYTMWTSGLSSRMLTASSQPHPCSSARTSRSRRRSTWTPCGPLKNCAPPTVDTVSRSFFDQAAPTPTPKLLLGAAPSEEAADQPKEAASVHTRRQRRTSLETLTPNHGSRTATQYGYTRDSVCIPAATTISVCNLPTRVVTPYSVMRSANPADQGHDKRSQRTNIVGFPLSATSDCISCPIGMPSPQTSGY